MYDIYINDCLLRLVTQQQIQASTGSAHLVMKYQGKPKEFYMYIDSLEKSKQAKTIILWSDDAKEMYRDFKSLYKVIRAAGGVVHLDSDIAMISRLGYWDLPKGKMEKGEKKKSAAKREIQEELGIFQVKIGKKLCRTFHTYKDKSGRRILKKTFWYQMYTTDETLTPQLEENIEEAIWLSPKDARELQPMYQNIRIVLDALE